MSVDVKNRAMDADRARTLIDRLWDEEIIDELVRYIRIPNKSPLFDADWAAHGYMDKAVAQFAAWAEGKIATFPGATLDVVRLPERTPVILIEIPGEVDDTVLLYGHLDKQPEMTGWADGLGPWTPVLRDGKLYGRGGADDGYAMFASIAALLAVADQRLPRQRAVILIEASEESASRDLPAYFAHLGDRIGTPSLIICLDSGCATYEKLWLTTSLRGVATGALRVDVLEEGVHSGDASGVVPSSFRILRQLLSRIEDEKSGEILLPTLHAPIPADRVAQAKATAAMLGAGVAGKYPFVPGMRAVCDDPAELLLNRTWRPALSITGLDGAPSIASGGNVLRPGTAVKLSMRLPPTVDASVATAAMKGALEADPPYGAHVSFEPLSGAAGWNAPSLAPWLAEAVDRASLAAFGKPAAQHGEGGSIPFMGMLGESFPQAQFVIAGVLGPQSNAHGPNEFLHIAMGKGVTLAMASILADHAARILSSR
ncbi:MAG: M20/M25/M40 family metallo-hydrolase [Sphingomonas sp.]|nr:M20/M25/M40 family metallo-hydrolase [Sphingomonas sp.]